MDKMNKINKKKKRKKETKPKSTWDWLTEMYEDEM